MGINNIFSKIGMSSMTKVAIVQAAPLFMDLEASLTRAIEFIGKAARLGAKLVVFGETWLPGYPAWLDYCPDAALWNHEPTKAVFAHFDGIVSTLGAYKQKR